MYWFGMDRDAEADRVLQASDTVWSKVRIRRALPIAIPRNGQLSPVKETMVRPTPNFKLCTTRFDLVRPSYAEQ